MKSLYDISLKISDEEYFNDGRIHHSTIATFDREGFNCLPTLFDKKESKSLTFGSAVDAIMTGGYNEFEKRFIVADIPHMSESMVCIANELLNLYKDKYNNIEDIPQEDIKRITDKLGYGVKWSINTIYNNVVSACKEYYSIIKTSDTKTLISSEMFSDIVATCNTLSENETTKWFFKTNDPFDNSIERFYQLKFAANINGVNYAVMFDIIIVDHKNKKIYLVDLKTSSNNEWDFFSSFIKWGYAHQARLYYRVILENLKNDEYFKDFEIEDFRFIVINKNNLTPLVWIFEDTKKEGKLVYGENNKIIINDTLKIGELVNEYINTEHKVPNEININSDNSIKYWLNKQ